MRERAQRTVMILLGLILLTAAGLKLYGLSVSPLPSVGWLSLPSVQLVVVAAEVFVGSWLASGVAKPFAWLAGLVVFGTFMAVSGYLTVIGQANCGCFGNIPTSPWMTFAVDAVAVSALGFVRPTAAALRNALRGPILHTGFALLTTTGMVLLVGAGITTLAFGSVAAGLAKLRGESLGFPGYIDFGRVKSGERAERDVVVNNWTGVPVRLIGGTSDCSCVTITDMPLTIPPFGSGSFRLYLSANSATSGTLARDAFIWTDCEPQRNVPLRLGCLVE